jgi:hypothetical protein
MLLNRFLWLLVSLAESSQALPPPVSGWIQPSLGTTKGWLLPEPQSLLEKEGGTCGFSTVPEAI